MYRGYIGILGYTQLYNIGILERKMETTTMGI